VADPVDALVERISNIAKIDVGNMGTWARSSGFVANSVYSTGYIVGAGNRGVDAIAEGVACVSCASNIVIANRRVLVGVGAAAVALVTGVNGARVIVSAFGGCDNATSSTNA